MPPIDRLVGYRLFAKNSLLITNVKSYAILAMKLQSCGSHCELMACGHVMYTD